MKQKKLEIYQNILIECDIAVFWVKKTFEDLPVSIMKHSVEKNADCLKNFVEKDVVYRDSEDQCKHKLLRYWCNV